jgi:dihydroorotate dehydrogenase
MIDTAVVREGAYERALRPLLFLLAPDTAHELAFAALAPLERLGWVRAWVRGLAGAPDAAERVASHVMGLAFPSIVGLAGGFDKNARRPRALAALGFGHLELGTVTARPQVANPRPNLFRLRADRALVNRLGFPNEGAERLAARLGEVRRGGSAAAIGVPIGVSIGKSRVVPVDDLDAVVADYVAAFDAVHGVADFVVVNVSSPNTAGLRTMQAREHALTLLSALRRRAASSERLLVKIAPDLSDAQLEDVLSVVDEVGLDGVVATNTTIARAGLTTPAAAVEAIGAGGLSGPPLRQRAVDVVRRVRARLGRRVAVIGVGGIEEAEHALALVRAGADLVQMYTGFVYGGPLAAARIGRGLARLVEREGAASIADLVGAG